MNKKYKKILATGLALNMMLINIPYNVFANSDMIENVILNEDNVPFIGEQNKSDLDDLIIEDEYILNNKDLIVNNNKESDFNYINDGIASEHLESVILEDNSIITENNNENVLNSVTDFTEDKNIVKSTMPSVTNYADSFAGGDGTEENPYQISNALELARLAYLINEEDLDTTNMYFELIDDIDLSDFDSDNNDSNGNWIPVGYVIHYRDNGLVSFKGSFNGNGFKISNVKITPSDYLLGVGLFGCIENANIANIEINNINILQGSNVGALAGYSEGDLTLSNITISELSCYSENIYQIGGLIGEISEGNFNANNNAVVKSNLKAYSNVGGIAGKFDDVDIKINDFEFNGTLNGVTGRTSHIGGISGEYYNNSRATDIFINNATINGDIFNENTFTSLGGIFGRISKENGNITLSNNNIEGSIGDKNNSTINYVGGLIGQSWISDCKNEIINNNINLSNFYGYYLGGIIGYSSSLYNSTFDGNNVVISNDFISRYYGGGMFGSACSGANLKINKFKFSGNLIDISPNTSYLGGIAGSLSGANDINIENVEIRGSISKVDGTCSYLGGLIGYTESILNIKNSCVEVDIYTNYEMREDLKGYNYTGGFVGYGASTNINKSYYKGALEGGNVGGMIGCGYYSDIVLSVTNSYINSILKGNFKNAGIISVVKTPSASLKISNFYIVSKSDEKSDDISLISDSTISDTSYYSNVYYNKDLYNIESIDFIGLTTEQMQGLNAKENMHFDYDNVWKLNKEYYPTFEQLNTAPELSGSDIELILNQNYNLLDYVTVEDFEDKDLIPEIETNLDITKIGNYTAIFTVTDPQGLTDELTLNIKVVAEKPTINANDLTLYIGDKFNPLDKVTAIDINGNDITEHIKVIENKVDTSKKGIYKVVYQVDSLERLSTTKEIKVTVLEKEINNNSSSDNKVESNKNESSTTDKPQTGDNFMVYWISLLASLVGLLYIKISKKTNKLYK